MQFPFAVHLALLCIAGYKLLTALQFPSDGAIHLDRVASYLPAAHFKGLKTYSSTLHGSKLRKFPEGFAAKVIGLTL
jgi:hypothetical protein